MTNEHYEVLSACYEDMTRVLTNLRDFAIENRTQERYIALVELGSLSASVAALGSLLAAASRSQEAFEGQ